MGSTLFSVVQKLSISVMFWYLDELSFVACNYSVVILTANKSHQGHQIFKDCLFVMFGWF